MRPTRLGALLLGLGVLVGVLAALGLLVGFEPARLPAALLNVAAYKLTFLAAFGLLAAGAVVQRHAHRAARTRDALPHPREAALPPPPSGESPPEVRRGAPGDRAPAPRARG